MNEPEAHRHFSADCFNRVWSLLDQPTRSAEEDRLMREMAHASLFHWLRRDDCLPTHLSVGLWQISRVYASLGLGEEAMAYARECQELSAEHELPPFYLGYAWEAAARAARVLGRDKECDSFLRQARDRLDQISDAEERNLLAADLDQVS